METDDYYGQSHNPNLYILNNANPFLITAYDPPVNNGECCCCELNTIQSSDPSLIMISVESNIDIAAPYTMTIGGQTVYTDRIYTCGNVSGTGPSVTAICDPPSVQITTDGAVPVVTVESGQTIFTDGNSPGVGSYVLNINGGIQVQGAPSAISIVTSSTTPVGYLPIQVGTPSQTYYIPLFQ